MLANGELTEDMMASAAVAGAAQDIIGAFKEDAEGSLEGDLAKIMEAEMKDTGQNFFESLEEATIVQALKEGTLNEIELEAKIARVVRGGGEGVGRRPKGPPSETPQRKLRKYLTRRGAEWGIPRGFAPVGLRRLPDTGPLLFT